MRRNLLYKKLFKKTNLCKFRKFDYQKLFYYSKFNKIPYKDKFLYSKGSRLVRTTNGSDFYAHNGRYWFKLKVNRWNSGMSTRSFIWSKKPAVFKKKKK